MVIEMPKIGFDDQLPMTNHLIQIRQKRVNTVNSTISGTGKQQVDSNKLLENIGLINIDWSLSRSDSKHRYKILDFVWLGNTFL
jgi:hypothetical protein